MDILYKPKCVLNFGQFGFNNNVFSYKTFCALTEKLVGDSLFQLEISNIIKPNENMEFNISELFNNLIMDHADIKKHLEINQFNIFFQISKNYTVVWPEKSESVFIENIDSHKHFTMLTFDEFMIKSALE